LVGEFNRDVRFELPSYAFFAARLLGLFNRQGKPTGGNTFITFNYDTLLEDGFHSLKVPFSYGFDSENAKLSSSAKASFDETAIKVLKLHGSVNWQCQPSLDLMVQRSLGDYEEVRKERVSPELVPPTWQKVFGGALWDVWTQAINSLHTATRIIVIGFSIPPTDTHFRFLISAGLKENISLERYYSSTRMQQSCKSALCPYSDRSTFHPGKSGLRRSRWNPILVQTITQRESAGQQVRTVVLECIRVTNLRGEVFERSRRPILESELTICPYYLPPSSDSLVRLVKPVVEEHPVLLAKQHRVASEPRPDTAIPFAAGCFMSPVTALARDRASGIASRPRTG